VNADDDSKHLAELIRKVSELKEEVERLHAQSEVLKKRIEEQGRKQGKRKRT